MKDQGVARTLLDHYRDSLSPSQQTRERMLREVSQRIASGATPSIQLDATTPLVQPAAAGGTSPLVVAAVAAGAAALLAVGALWWRERPNEPPPAMPHVHSAAPVRAPEAIEPAAPAAEASEPEAEIAAAPPVVPGRRSVQSRSSTPRRSTPRASDGLGAVAPAEAPPAAKPAPTDPPKPPAAPQAPSVAPSAAGQDELVEELRLIRAAYAALQADKPQVALARVDEHSARFPHGKLAESREVARIMALCQSGKTAQGRAQIARFLARSPGSAYAVRVRTLCSEPAGNR